MAKKKLEPQIVASKLEECLQCCRKGNGVIPKVLGNKQLHAIDDGWIQTPQKPGLGLDLIEEASDEHHIREHA